MWKYYKIKLELTLVCKHAEFRFKQILIKQGRKHFFFFMYSHCLVYIFTIFIQYHYFLFDTIWLAKMIFLFFILWSLSLSHDNSKQLVSRIPNPPPLIFLIVFSISLSPPTHQSLLVHTDRPPLSRLSSLFPFDFHRDVLAQFSPSADLPPILIHWSLL